MLQILMLQIAQNARLSPHEKNFLYGILLWFNVVRYSSLFQSFFF